MSNPDFKKDRRMYIHCETNNENPHYHHLCFLTQRLVWIIFQSPQSFGFFLRYVLPKQNEGYLGFVRGYVTKDLMTGSGK